MAEPPIDLTLERLARLENLVTQRFDASDQRLETIEASLGKMVTVLEAHDQRLEGISAVDRRGVVLELASERALGPDCNTPN